MKSAWDDLLSMIMGTLFVAVALGGMAAWGVVFKVAGVDWTPAKTVFAGATSIACAMIVTVYARCAL